MSVEFFAAARAAEMAEDEDVVEVTIEGVAYKARRPTTAQIALVVATDGKDLGVIFRVLDSILGREALAVIEDMVWDRRIDIDDLFGGTEANPKGLLGAIVEEFRAGNPTQPSTGSSRSQAPAGPRSTGRSRGKGSIRSDSTSSSSTPQS